jgi:hypothetical protein
MRQLKRLFQIFGEESSVLADANDHEKSRPFLCRSETCGTADVWLSKILSIFTKTF